MNCCSCRRALPEGRKNKYCTDCARESSYRWRQKNAERWREIKNGSARKRDREMPERKRQKYREYYDSNREAITARMRERLFTKCASCGQPFDKPQSHNRCKDCNADKCGRRRAVLAQGGKIDYARVAAKTHGLCGICGLEPDLIHWDHIIPIILGGPHSEDNLQLTCSSCNLRKGARLIEGVMAFGEVSPVNPRGSPL